MAKAPDALHVAILCVDIEGFTAAGRSDRDRLEARTGLYGALERAFKRAGIPWDQCYREDRGDGAFILVPAEVPKNRLVASLPSALADEIGRHNASSGPRAAFRLRAVVDAGEVSFDRNGAIGHGLNQAFRLLEAPGLKAALRESDRVLALIASEWFFDNVIRQDPQDEPAAYERIQVAVKETRTTALVRLFAAPEPTARRPMKHWRPGRRHRVLALLTVQAAGVLVIAAGEVAPPRCDVVPAQIRVLASAETEAVIRSVALDFERSYRGPDGCHRANVHVTSAPYTGPPEESIQQGWLNGGLGETSNEADVWLPDSSLEVEQVREVLTARRIPGIRLDVAGGSYARSPLVVAVPTEMAGGLGLAGRTVGWREVFSWPARGYSLGRASPRTSSVGLAATVALYRAKLGREVLDAATLAVRGAPERLHEVEHAISPGDDDPIRQLCALRESPQGSPLRRTAFLVTEKSVADYRRGAPLGARCSGPPPQGAPALLPLYAEEGIPVLDHPYVVIRREPAARDAARQRVVDAFFGYLKGPDAQQRIREAGYRDPAGSADLGDQAFLEWPDTVDLTGTVRFAPLLRAWDTARRSAQVLFLVDVSREMGAPFPYVQGTRLAAAADAIRLSRRLIGARDQIGLWEFGRRWNDHGTLLPLGPPDPGRLESMTAKLERLRPGRGGAGMRAAVGAAITQLRRAGGPDTTKAVIVIADGADTSGGAPSLAGLAADLATGTQVRVFVTAFRPESCVAGLDEITGDSGGACFEIDGMTTMRRALDGIAAGLWGNPRPG